MRTAALPLHPPPRDSPPPTLPPTDPPPYLPHILDPSTSFPHSLSIPFRPTINPTLSTPTSPPAPPTHPHPHPFRLTPPPYLGPNPFHPPPPLSSPQPTSHPPLHHSLKLLVPPRETPGVLATQPSFRRSPLPKKIYQCPLPCTQSNCHNYTD
ncbi:pollen-specific leucine-rich repeat extensin-like protein 1 [Homalodisca vitripennis]|uniref:pollen-specific leucine-rich repeat extensin-like protein 1 n=1 Tax=Homalodisca vitripennis TaxID=197043 RepID=UPI001EEB8B9D|nr:pollen-specific leucine-rich repeat extensin-like protein 1 [Homalodisca vitripennis]